MIIYNPHNEAIIKKREVKIKEILEGIPAKHCFITGSFLWKEAYNDIDIFAITRRKLKEIIIIDFNDLHSLFYHSITKSCISKNILPKKSLKVTISDYWHVINEAIPTILNQKDMFHKDIRFLILYTEYFKNNYVLDTYELNKMIENFKDHNEILDYVKSEVPQIINKHTKKSYINRFFYTQSGFYKDSLSYDSIKYLYELCHSVIAV